jgi:hypothetical protein
MGFIISSSEHVLLTSVSTKCSVFIQSSIDLKLISIHILIQFVYCIYSEAN